MTFLPGLARSGFTTGAVELRHREKLAALQAIVLRLAGAALIFFHIAARQNPVAARRAQALFDVDRHGIVRVRTGCVVEPDRRLAARQRHFAERHAVDHAALREPGNAPRVIGDGFGIENGFVHFDLSLRRFEPDQVQRDSRDCDLSSFALNALDGTPGKPSL